MTENSEHYVSNLLGWKAVRGELRLDAFDRLVMADVTEDVRLRNVFVDLGCKSINDFLGIIAKFSPRNYGKRSESYLAECLNMIIIKRDLVSGVHENAPVVCRAVELQVIYGGWDAIATLRFVGPGLWNKWRIHCLGLPDKELDLKQHLTSALIDVPAGVPSMKLSEALTKWHTLDSLLCENNETLLSVIRATAWCANQSNLLEIDNYLAENQSVLSDALSLLDATPRSETLIDTHAWNVLWGIVKLRGSLDCKVGELVTQANVNWPSNRLADPIKAYYETSPQRLLQRDIMGKVKALALTRCLAYLSVYGHRPSSAPVPPWEIVKRLKLKKSYTNVLNIRYGGSRVPTLDACGKKLGVTRERVRQIEAKCSKLSKLMQYSDSAVAWLNFKIDNIWAQLSVDGGVTVDSKDESELALQKKLEGEYRLGLLLANIRIIQLLDISGNRTENGWSSRTKGAGEIVVKLSGKVKVVDI